MTQKMGTLTAAEKFEFYKKFEELRKTLFEPEQTSLDEATKYLSKEFKFPITRERVRKALADGIVQPWLKPKPGAEPLLPGEPDYKGWSQKSVWHSIHVRITNAHTEAKTAYAKAKALEEKLEKANAQIDRIMNELGLKSGSAVANAAATKIPDNAPQTTIPMLAKVG
jgi:hypothetical protein